MSHESSEKAGFSQDELRSLLKSKKLKVTSSRIAVLSVLADAHTPLSHADVQQRLGDSVVDQSTVFRNLNDLFDAGLVNRTELGDRTWRFELLRDEQTDDHPHFVCTDCGNVSCLPESAIHLKNNQTVKGVGTIREVLVKGQCLDCEKTKD